MNKFSPLIAFLISIAFGQSLPTINGDPDSVTVSGHQEGATFACSLQIILSATIKGAGCVKGGPFAFDRETLGDG